MIPTPLPTSPTCTILLLSRGSQSPLEDPSPKPQTQDGYKGNKDEERRQREARLPNLTATVVGELHLAGI